MIPKVILIVTIPRDARKFSLGSVASSGIKNTPSNTSNVMIMSGLIRLMLSKKLFKFG